MMKFVENLHAYSSIIGPSTASQMQNKSVFRYFFCSASYTPENATGKIKSIKKIEKRNKLQKLFQMKRLWLDVPFSIQSISLRDSASIGMSFLIFISEDDLIIPKKIANRYFEFYQKS